MSAGQGYTLDAGCALGLGSYAADALSDVAKAVQQDPPDPNYTEVFVPKAVAAGPIVIPGVPSNVASAIWATINSLDESTLWLNAVRVTANRYGTALNAGDAASADLQYRAFLHFLGLYLEASNSTSMNLASLASALQSAGLATQPVSGDQITRGLNYLSAQGSSSEFLNQFFSSLGFTTAQIQTMIQQALANPPAAPTVSPVQALQALSNVLVNAGVHLGSSPPSVILDSGAGTYVATLYLVNEGSVPIDTAQIKSAALGTTPLLSYSGPITKLLPWQGAVVTLSFSASAISPVLKSAPLKINGTYSAGALSGNWALTFRSVTLGTPIVGEN